MAWENYRFIRSGIRPAGMQCSQRLAGKAAGLRRMENQTPMHKAFLLLLLPSTAIQKSGGAKLLNHALYDYDAILLLTWQHVVSWLSIHSLLNDNILKFHTFLSLNKARKRPQSQTKISPAFCSLKSALGFSLFCAKEGELRNRREWVKSATK